MVVVVCVVCVVLVVTLVVLVVLVTLVVLVLVLVLLIRTGCRRSAVVLLITFQLFVRLWRELWAGGGNVL